MFLSHFSLSYFKWEVCYGLHLQKCIREACAYLEFVVGGGQGNGLYAIWFTKCSQTTLLIKGRYIYYYYYKIVNNILLYVTYNNIIPYYIYKYLIQRYIYLFYIFHLMNPNMLRFLVKSAFIQMDHETSNLII